MADPIQPAAPIHIDIDGNRSTIRQYSVQATSGTLGSVIHGFEVEVLLAGDRNVTLRMRAADALQLAEEIRSAAHSRGDVRR